jgi:hypothetical protein
MVRDRELSGTLAARGTHDLQHLLTPPSYHRVFVPTTGSARAACLLGTSARMRHQRLTTCTDLLAGDHVSSSKDPSKPVLLVGDPGAAKSVTLARYVQRRIRGDREEGANVSEGGGARFGSLTLNFSRATTPEVFQVARAPLDRRRHWHSHSPLSR